MIPKKIILVLILSDQKPPTRKREIEEMSQRPLICIALGLREKANTEGTTVTTEKQMYAQRLLTRRCKSRKPGFLLG